jgi:hypothetical protein
LFLSIIFIFIFLIKRPDFQLGFGIQIISQTGVENIFFIIIKPVFDTFGFMISISNHAAKFIFAKTGAPVINLSVTAAPGYGKIAIRPVNPFFW